MSALGRAGFIPDRHQHEHGEDRGGAWHPCAPERPLAAARHCQTSGLHRFEGARLAGVRGPRLNSTSSSTGRKDSTGVFCIELLRVMVPIINFTESLFGPDVPNEIPSYIMLKAETSTKASCDAMLGAAAPSQRRESDVG